MARQLADIITEISSSYNPLKDRANNLYSQQFAEVAPQEQADLSGLEQAKNNAFESINTGANRRGMFYSGVPIAEQSKYVGENYLPSIASLKNRYAGIRDNLKQTLYQTLASYDTQAASRGNDIYQQELARDEQIRQFNETLAAQERAAAASRASSAGSGSGSGSGSAFSPSSLTPTNNTGTGVLGASSTGSINVPGATAQQIQSGYADVNYRINNASSAAELWSDYQATASSAKNGNKRDLAKLQAYRLLRPDIFGAAYGWEATGGQKAPVGSGVRAPATLPVSKTTPTSSLLKPFGI